MPDRADVEQALAALIAGVLYPDGAGGSSAVGLTCRIYRGWPVAAALEADLAAGVVHATVQPVTGSVRDTTRYSQEWQGAAPAVTLLASVAGEVVGFEGAALAGQVAGILVDGLPYAYRVRAGDTAGLVAAVLAGLIRADRPAVLHDATVLLPGGRGVVARVVADGRGGRELRRQDAGFRVTLWCPEPGVRDRVAALVDLAVAGMAFLDVGGWACRVRLSGGSSTDEGSAGGAWRRDLLYSVEYPTVAEESLPAMLFGINDVNGVVFAG